MVCKDCGAACYRDGRPRKAGRIEKDTPIGADEDV